MTWLAVALAFLLGSIPGAVLVGRAARVDVLREGSGNPGATNAWRTAGPLAGLLALALDAAKGWVAVAWLPPLVAEPEPWLPAALGAAAVLGHLFNPFLLFRGGKGVATSAGAIAALSPWLLVVPVVLFGVVFALRRRVSEASLAAALALPLAAAVWRLGFPAGAPDRPLLALTVVIAVLVWIRHRGNLRRIRSGDEPRLTD